MLSRVPGARVAALDGMHLLSQIQSSTFDYEPVVNYLTSTISDLASVVRPHV